MLRRRRGHDLGHYRRSYVLRRIQSRARALGLPDLEAYASFLTTRIRETDELLSALSVSVTQFFRNPSFFRTLDRHILAGLLDGQRERHVAIWSAGCATGEEAYSIAMLLASRDREERANLLATD